MSQIKKVLVVDDSKLARLTLSRLLKERNLEVVEAESVDDCMTVLEHETVDAIFMDVMMPEKNGFEGLNLIKNDPKLNHIPCSMYSGDLSIEAQKKAISSGAQAYLFKPASEEGLSHVMQALQANIVADDMQKYTKDGYRLEEGEEKDNSQQQQQQQVFVLDNRTRNLARIVSQERKENAAVLQLLEEKINTFNSDLHTVKEQSYNHAREDMDRKRTENDLRSQLQNARDRMKTLGTLAIFAAIIAIVSVVLQFT